MARSLAQQLGRQLARAQALAALTSELAATHEPQTVLERAVDAAAELLGAHTVAAFLRRADGRGFDAPAARGLAPLEQGTPALSMERSIAGRALRTGAVQAIEDAAVERAKGTEFPRLAGDVPVGALLVAPIVESGRAPMGVLEVYMSTPHTWEEEDRLLLRGLAAACAVALRSARETTQARHDAARFRTLARLSAEIIAASDPDTVLRLLVSGACNALEASRAWLLRRAGAHGPVTTTHEYAVPGYRPAKELVDVPSSRVWAQMEAQGDRPQPFVVDDIAERPDLLARWAPVEPAQRPQAILAIPLLDEGRLTGVLGVHQCGQPRYWAAEEIDFLQALAAQAGLALRQRRLLASTREDAQRLAALNRVAEAVIGARSFGAMCDRALETLTEVLGTDAGTIYVHDGAAPPDRVLRMVAWRGIADETASDLATLPLGAGLIGQAALRRTIVVAERFEETPPDAMATLPRIRREEGLEGSAAVPMLVRGHLIGALFVAARRPHPWTGADCALLQTVANQLAVALEAEQLRHAAAAAEAAREANRLKDELLSTVSHELRTPLGAIKGFTSGLLHYGDRLDGAERLESLRFIEDAVDRLSELIDNLLDLQRLEAGRLAVAHDVVDLAHLAAAVVKEMAPRAPNHTLHLHSAAGVPPVRGDARRLRQVLQNLVENAVKYSPDGGHIHIHLTPRDSMVELQVEDEGLGIPPDQLAQIFTRFHRVDNSTTRRVGGTGLGLSIVKGLVTAHDGTISAHSAGEGHGSTFVVTLPGARSRSRGAGAKEPRP